LVLSVANPPTSTKKKVSPREGRTKEEKVEFKDRSEQIRFNTNPNATTREEKPSSNTFSVEELLRMRKGGLPS